MTIRGVFLIALVLNFYSDSLISARLFAAKNSAAIDKGKLQAKG